MTEMKVKTRFLGALSVWVHPATSSPRGRVLIVHGVNEHSERHLNTVNALTSSGLEVVRFDLRGAGRSGGRRQWIERFSDYIEDVQIVHNWINRDLELLPLFLLGHSMGGAISIYFTEFHNHDLSGLILSAPAYKVGSAISSLKIAIGRFLSNYTPTLSIPSSPDHSALSRDPTVAKAYEADPLNHQSNTVRQGNEVLNALEHLPTKSNAIAVPVLIVHGSADRVILLEGSFELLMNLSSNDKTLHIIPGGYHETHNDVDKEEYFQLLLHWIDRHLNEEKKTQPKEKVNCNTRNKALHEPTRSPD